MKVGDIVTWTSQAGSVFKEKQGEIIAIVPKNKAGGKIWTALGRQSEFRSFSPSSGVREHESYLVAVSTTETSKPQVYWPLVALLKLDGATPKAKAAVARDGSEEAEDFEDETENETETEDDETDDETEDEEDRPEG